MLSVLLPSIRPDRVYRVLENLRAQTDAMDAEIIVVASFPAPSPEPWWIQRERRGVIDAVNVACAHAKGDIWFLTNDETTCRPGCLQALVNAVNADPLALYSPVHKPDYPFVYYGKPFAAFPCAHRDLIKALGGLLDPVYRGFYADPDLSLRAHDAGVPIRIVDDAVIDHHNETGRWDHQVSVSAFLEQDRATFRARWDHLGEFVDP